MMVSVLRFLRGECAERVDGIGSRVRAIFVGGSHMAPTVPNNPFDTQQSSSGGGIITGAMGNNVTTATTPTPVATSQPAQFQVQERQVNRATETAAGQVESLLAQDSPLMQRARTLASHNINQPGLGNSSNAPGAARAASNHRTHRTAKPQHPLYTQPTPAN